MEKVTIIPRLIGKFLIAVSILHCSSKASMQRATKPAKNTTLAILLFENKTNQIAVTDHRFIIQNTLVAQLANEPNISVLERTNVNHILKEIETSQTGLTSSEKGFQAGKLLNADAILIGSIDNLEVKKRDTELFILGDMSKVKITVDLSARIVDVQTGRIIVASQISLKESEIDVTNFLVFVSHKSKIDENALRASLLRDSAVKLSKDLKMKLSLMAG
jgi:curli biogenesis system outer membrane secretion channel CsgG